MEQNLEQRYAIKFCVKLNKTATETFALIQEAYGSKAMSRGRVFEWHHRFRGGQESVSDENRSGRPSTTSTDDNKARVDGIVMQDRRVTVREIADQTQIPKSSVQGIIDDLGYHKVCARWVPRLLTEEQRHTRVMICRQWRSRMRREGAEHFLKRIVTCDETWVYQYDPESKQQSSVWVHSGSPRPQKAKVCKSANKVMHLIFFDYQGIIYDHVVVRGHTITGQYYSDVLKNQLLQKMRAKRPELIANGWILHHDNAPPHTSQVCRDTIDELEVEILAHPAYSPDLAPCDFFLFPELKKRIRGHHFQSSEEVNNAVMGILKTLSEEGFLKVFEMWQERWNKCILSEGHYFESA